MGFQLSLIKAKFHIKAKALAAAIDEYESFEEFEELLLASGWSVTRDPKGNITEIGLEWDSLRGGINAVLLDLAPHVKAGSFITLGGDDGAIGSWKFDGAHCKCIGFARDDDYEKYLEQAQVSDEDEDEDEDESEDDETEEVDDDDDEDDDDGDEDDDEDEDEDDDEDP